MTTFKSVLSEWEQTIAEWQGNKYLRIIVDAGQPSSMAEIERAEALKGKILSAAHKEYLSLQNGFEIWAEPIGVRIGLDCKTKLTILSTSALQANNWVEKNEIYGDDFIMISDYEGIDRSYGYRASAAGEGNPAIVQYTEEGFRTTAMDLVGLMKKHLDTFRQYLRDGANEVKNQIESAL